MPAAKGSASTPLGPITYRPLPESGMLAFKQWLQNENWLEVYQLETAHQKAEYLHKTLIEKMDCFLPEKTIKVRKDDQPWANNEIKALDRR